MFFDTSVKRFDKDFERIDDCAHAAKVVKEDCEQLAMLVPVVGTGKEELSKGSFGDLSG